MKPYALVLIYVVRSQSSCCYPNKVLLEYIQYGQKLADEISKWGRILRNKQKKN